MALWYSDVQNHHCVKQISDEEISLISIKCFLGTYLGGSGDGKDLNLAGRKHSGTRRLVAEATLRKSPGVCQALGAAGRWAEQVKVFHL